MDDLRPAGSLDAHQHFWRYDAREYPWIPPGSPLERDWLPVDLQREQEPLRFGGSIAVQARQTLEETRWLLALAEHAPAIRGVVGWVDLRSPHVEEDLAQLAQNRKLVGVRHVVQDEPDPRFLLGTEFQRGLALLRHFRLAYDLLILPHQLSEAIELVTLHPEQRFVLDHLAKPPIRERGLEPWRSLLREFASAPNVCAKLSGLVTEADHRHWRDDDFQPYVETALEVFGSDRLMFGSDWPVCLLAAPYGEVVRLAEQATRGLPPDERGALFGRTAERFYGV